jgi:hypothetical protein
MDVGTLFVLVKKTSSVDDLLVAIRDNDESRVLKLVDQLTGTASISAPAENPIIKGKWQLLWSKPGDTSNRLQTALVGQVTLI